MADVSERLDNIEQALATTNEQLGEVKGRLEKHDERFNQIDADVLKLRVLEEENSSQIKLIAEVQSRHGEKLDELAKGIEPLKVLPDLFKQVVQDHERRITALERR